MWTGSGHMARAWMFRILGGAMPAALGFAIWWRRPEDER